MARQMSTRTVWANRISTFVKAELQRADVNYTELARRLWFNNVERVAAARIGQEPVRYVRNIYKYYVAYRLIEEADAAKKAAIAAAKTRPAAAGANPPPQPAKLH